jgi:hypothetical protein
MVWQEWIYGSCIVGGVKYMNKKTILSIALVCVLLVSSGAVASGVFSSFAREKAPMEVEEQRISPMTFLPELPLPPEIPPVIPIPPELPPMPIAPEIPPEESPEEPPVELPELPEVITVNMILDQLSHTIVPDGFEWLYVEIVSCLEDYTGDKDANLRDEENFTPFLNYVVDYFRNYELPEGFEQYQSLLEYLIDCLTGWSGTPDDLIEYLLACIEGWATIPVPEIPIPPEIPILPGF